MIVRVDGTGEPEQAEGASVTFLERPDGVNPPAAVTLVVHYYGKGELGILLVGGDPEFEGEDQEHPTIFEGTYHGDERTFEVA